MAARRPARKPRVNAAMDAQVRRALAAISPKELTELTCALIDIPSRTGEEERCARFLVDYMRRRGLEATWTPPSRASRRRISRSRAPCPATSSPAPAWRTASSTAWGPST